MKITAEEADALRDAADIMDKLAGDGDVRDNLELTYRAVTGEGLRRYADKYEDR
jgi:hypothetical protein